MSRARSAGTLLRRLGARPRQESSLERGMRRISQASDEVLRRYEPGPYPGRLVLFRADRLPARHHGDPYLGWAGLADGGIEVHEISGAYPTILDEAPARVVAGELRALLREAQERC